MAATTPSPRFIGRRAELQSIAVALRDVAAGDPRTIILTGPGGIGVSRLIDETERRVAALPKPFRVVRCRSFAGRSGEPYRPVADALHGLVAGLSDAELRASIAVGVDAITGLVPSLASRIGPPGVVPTLAPEHRQARLLESILAFLHRLGDDRPVVLVLEDLHHADAGSRALARFVARVRRPGRLLTILTYQPDELTPGHPLVADLASIDEAMTPPTRIELGPLGRDELADLIEGIEGTRPSASLLLLAFERSAGNPLVAEEVLATRRARDGVAPGGTLDDLIEARVALLGPECRRLLRLLAPAEQPLTPEELAAVSTAYESGRHGVPPRSATRPRRGTGGLDADLAAGLEDARRHGLVVDIDGGLMVRHERIGRAIIADLLPEHRRRVNVALANALAERPAVAARQWRAAFDPTRARSAALAAADLAESAASPADALAWLELALATEPPLDRPDGSESSQLLARAGDMAFAAGAPSRAVAYLENAVGRLDERTDRVEVGLLLERLGRYRRVLGEHEAGLAAHRRAVELVPRGETRERAIVLATLAQSLMLDGWFVEGERVAGEAIATARAVGADARREEGHALCTLGIAKAWGRQPDESIPLLEEARSIAEEIGQLDDRFRATANLTTALEIIGRRDDAIAAAFDGIEQSRRDGLEAAHGNPLRGNVAESLFQTGRWDEARQMAATALEWSLSPEGFIDAAIGVAVVDVESRSDEQTARLLGRLLLELRHAPDHQSLLNASKASAAFALWRGDVGDAARAIGLGWEMVRPTEDWVNICRLGDTLLEVAAARVADAQERRDLLELSSARAAAQEALAAVDAAISSAGLEAQAPSRREAEAHVAAAHGYFQRLDGRDDPGTWGKAAALWASVGGSYQVAKARWRQAEATLSSTDAREGRRAARRPLLDALEISDRLDARPLQRELTELAARAMISLGPRPSVVSDDGRRYVSITIHTDGEGEAIGTAFAPEPASARKDPFALSAREREVLALIAQGRTNREIGERLYISQKTVGVHVGNILAKLGASGRVEAAMVAVRLGLVART
jgi:DNA-binding CsgD family transcriptional regulator